MRVFHREHTGRPLRVVWTLEELGQPYELEVMTHDQGRSAEHMARHPLGRVPVIEDDEGFVFESAAICMHLADLWPQAGLLPPPGAHARALAYQWAIFAPAELEPPLIEAARFAQADPERAAKARSRFATAADAVARSLDGRAYLVGDGFTVADVLITSALAFASRAGFPEVLAPAARDYVARQQERPAYQTALQRTSELPAST
ncbi:MAG TPA: glutathione S-transferase family protein [Solirubrobacteraceae bacterium]|nr:glutathione S-transferase family protein [Solirubrobacteraceae bacterium]